MRTTARFAALAATAATAMILLGPAPAASASPPPSQPLAGAFVSEGPTDADICPVLVELHQITGGRIGPFWIYADGDVWLVDPFGLFPVFIYDCPPYSLLPSQATIDPLETLKRDLNPAVCPIFSELANDTGGGVLGAVLINPDGDVYVAQPLGRGYTREWDCPPFAN